MRYEGSEDKAMNRVLGFCFSLQKDNPGLPSLTLEEFPDDQEITGPQGHAVFLGPSLGMGGL